MFGSRMLAVMAVAFVATGPLAGTHVHSYTDHDHPEHHHGPAVHAHERRADAAAVRQTGNPILAPCDPEHHEVVVQATSRTATAPCFGMPAVRQASGLQPEPLSRVTGRRVDVRVHGPPGLTPTPPRAPPVVLPA